MYLVDVVVEDVADVAAGVTDDAGLCFTVFISAIFFRI